MKYGLILLLALGPLVTLRLTESEPAGWWPPPSWAVTTLGVVMLLVFLTASAAGLSP